MMDINNAISKGFCKWVSKKINRDQTQVKYLLEVLNYNISEYFELEESIKRFHVSYCPGDLAECYYLILKLRVYKELKWIEDKPHDLLHWNNHGVITLEWDK